VYVERPGQFGRKKAPHYLHPVTPQQIEMETYIAIAHHTTTVLVALWMLAGGASIFLKKKFIHDVIQRLGYPDYFAYILGAAKLIGAAFLLFPFHEQFKTLAFSGATIELLCATGSYYVIDKRFTEWVKPIILLAVVWVA
jgi:hypothetical protein